MIWPWQEGRGDDRALPRWHHWILAALLIGVAMLVTPIFAAFL
ncbi:hypothetical protein [Sphingobium sp. RAC03]|nr:hypothetical protein [Sphingobium sp. RAC03]